MIIKFALIKCSNQAVTSFPDADMALYYIYVMNYMYVTHIFRPYKVFHDCCVNIYGHPLDTKPVTIFCPRCMHILQWIGNFPPSLIPSTVSEQAGSAYSIAG